MKIKVCGMRDPENIRQAEALPIDMMGFIFYTGSSRFVGDIDPVGTHHVKRIGVFVNQDMDTLLSKVDTWKLHGAQLHGNEPPEDCTILSRRGITVIKAFSIGMNFDFIRLEPYIPAVDYFLFDTKGMHYGGNGKTFDWTILENYPFNKPFILSGGLHPGLAVEIKKLDFPLLKAIDVNSGFEEKPGYKNIKKLKNFIDELQS